MSTPAARYYVDRPVHWSWWIAWTLSVLLLLLFFVLGLSGCGLTTDAVRPTRDCPPPKPPASITQYREIPAVLTDAVPLPARKDGSGYGIAQHEKILELWTQYMQCQRALAKSIGQGQDIDLNACVPPENGK